MSGRNPPDTKGVTVRPDAVDRRETSNALFFRVNGDVRQIVRLSVASIAAFDRALLARCGSVFAAIVRGTRHSTAQHEPKTAGTRRFLRVVRPGPRRVSPGVAVPVRFGARPDRLRSIGKGAERENERVFLESIPIPNSDRSAVHARSREGVRSARDHLRGLRRPSTSGDPRSRWTVRTRWVSTPRTSVSSWSSLRQPVIAASVPNLPTANTVSISLIW